MNSIRFERFQDAGDIILIRTPHKIPLNRIFQAVATVKPARYTHVLLCVMPGLYIHSVTKAGVHFVAGEDDEGNFQAHYGDNWKVVRHNKLVQDHQVRANLAYRAAYYIGQKYNSTFALPAFSRHASRFLAPFAPSWLRGYMPILTCP